MFCVFLMIGIYYVFVIVGLVVGYLVGGVFFNIYVDVN